VLAGSANPAQIQRSKSSSYFSRYSFDMVPQLSVRRQLEGRCVLITEDWAFWDPFAWSSH
jgi:hypothetical protein